jgi:hypothetical protein
MKDRKVPLNPDEVLEQMISAAKVILNDNTSEAEFDAESEFLALKILELDNFITQCGFLPATWNKANWERIDRGQHVPSDQH